MKFTVAFMTKILGEEMKSRLEVIEAENKDEALKIYIERHPRLNKDQIVVEVYKW